MSEGRALEALEALGTSVIACVTELTIAQNALIELLGRKGIVTKEEYDTMASTVRSVMEGKEGSGEQRSS